MDAKVSADVRQSAGQARCLISRPALLHNALLIRNTVGPEVKICGVVKANAYGHGAALVARTLCGVTDADGEPLVDALAVADLGEAAAVADAGVPVIALRPIENAFLGSERDRLERAVRGGVILTICSLGAANDVARIAWAAGRRASVQIMVDTGMNRAGVSLEDLPRLAERIASLSALRLHGIATHFACSESPRDSLNARQLAAFAAATDGLEPPDGAARPLLSACNSGAIFFNPAAHLDMVRPGLSLYGIDPAGGPCIDRPLRPALKWVAPLIGIRDVAAGESAGYGQTWTAARPSRLGLLPVGYADGLPRALSNKGAVLLHGHVVPIVGRVSMDLTVVDLTEVPNPLLGDDVTLLDSDPLSPCSVYKHADWSDTIPYEVLCRIGPRVRRVLVDPELSGDHDEIDADADADDALLDERR